jgi:hypothetical protein
MNSDRKNKTETAFYITLLIAQLILLILYLIPQINNDLWNDEIYTLNHFTFVPLWKTCTDYHVPNNHIFFNLVNNIFLKGIGIDSLYDLMDHPWIIRLIPLTYSIITIIVTYFIGRKFFNRSTAYISIIILLTTIPFLNYAVQVRGYSLSMMLFTILLFYVMSFKTSVKTQKLFIISVLTALLAYTIPSNIYFIGALVFFFFIRFLYNYFSKIHLNIKASGSLIDLSIVIALTSGVGLALFLYYPVFYNVFFNGYVSRNSMDVFFSTDLFISISEKLISYRWLLLFISVTGAVLIIIYKKQLKINTVFLMMFIFLYVFPFAISTLRGDRPPDRVFIILTPVFSILFSAGMVYSIQKHRRLEKFNILWILLIFITSNASYAYGINKIKTQLMNDLNGDGRSQDVLNNYYQWYFHPNNEVLLLKKLYEPGKSIVVVAGGEPYDLPVYLQKNKIPFHNENYLDSLSNQDSSIYVFCTHIEKIKKRLYTTYPDCRIEMISKELSYHNLMSVQL